MGEDKGKKEIIFEKPKVNLSNAIREELFTFHQAITNNITPIVSLNDGYQALKIAHQILEKIKANLQKIG